jgi:hypothetical protein
MNNNSNDSNDFFNNFTYYFEENSINCQKSSNKRKDKNEKRKDKNEKRKYNKKRKNRKAYEKEIKKNKSKINNNYDKYDKRKSVYVKNFKKLITVISDDKNVTIDFIRYIDNIDNIIDKRYIVKFNENNDLLIYVFKCITETWTQWECHYDYLYLVKNNEYLNELKNKINLQYPVLFLEEFVRTIC